jgi:two-component system sensor histidine kinase and response regulator WspE
VNALIELLQGEIRQLSGELIDCVRLAADPGTAPGALARWARRVHALTGAFTVVEQAEWLQLAQALQQLGSGEDAAPLRSAAVGRALALLRAFADAPRSEAADWLATHAGEAAAVGSELGQGAGDSAPTIASDNPILGLFRQEVDEQSARISQLLLRLEQEPERLDLIAPVMRAAHSIKGAARAVRLEPVVSLAHALEDRLSAAQRQTQSVDEALIEYCLATVDLLRDFARAGSNDVLEARLRGLLSQANPVAPGAPAPPPPSPAVHTSTTMPPEPVAARTLTPAPTYIAAEDGDPVLRIKASLVGRLIALAGTGVVGAHRLRPFADRQQRLRQTVAQLGRLVDDLHHRLGAPTPGTAVGADLGELRRQIASARQHTQSWIDDFTDYARESFDLNERIFQAASLTRLRPFRDLVLGYPRMVRDLARQLGKRARLTIVGEGLEVDRDVLEKLDAPLTHLLRNALDHGLEPVAARVAAGKPEEGQLRIWATHRAGMLAIDISDDGAGIDLGRVRARLIDSGRLSADAAAALSDQALREHLFAPGFTTRSEVTEVSGRGVGLDVVRESVERLDGSVRLTTRAGHGTTFHLLVPISRAVTRALAVRSAGEVYAFPSLRIDRVVRGERADVVSEEGLQYLPLAGRNIGLVPLAELLDLGVTRSHGERLDVVVVEHQGRLVGFVVDEFLGEYDLATRPLDARLGRVADVGAVALLTDGTPVVLLDVDDLMRSALGRERASLSASESGPGDGGRRKRVLVVDDSISVRELERQLLAGRGFEVEVAVDGVDAWTRLRDESFDLLITDVDMPRMNGIELTRSIKQDPRLRALPVVIVSYRDRPEDRRRGLEARADSYLTKSDFQDESFLKLVHQLIGPAQAGS